MAGVSPERDRITFDPESELGAVAPTFPSGRNETHHHYHQSKGNHQPSSLTLLLGLCSALLVILVGIQGFMWTSQINFQQTMIDRMARVETKLGVAPAQ